MKERLKKELEVALIVFLFLTITYFAFFFLNVIKHPSITGLVVYNEEATYENYTFTNASLYVFNDSLVNLSSGIRLKAIYAYYNTTIETVNETNQTVNETIILSNITYPGSAILDTLDFSPSSLQSWGVLSKSEVLNDQIINYYYSIDSGLNFTLITDFNLSSVNSSKIRFRINLLSNTTETPIVDYITLSYIINIACIEDWQCNDWSECYENNTQIRDCIDNNACGSEDNKPNLTQSCIYTPLCTTNWTKLYNECLINNTKLMYYNDTSKCNNLTTIPSDNNTFVSCDYCVVNWTCISYGNCIDEEKTCAAVNDTNKCYISTNLSSDNYTGDYSEFTAGCNMTNATQSSSGSASSEEGGEPAAAAAGGGESAASQTEEISLEPECSYDVSVDIPDAISFVEESSFKANIKNNGCKVDKLSLSVSDELKKIIRLDNYEIDNLEKDSTASLNLSTDPVLTRTKSLIHGMAAKVVQKQIKNITGSLMLKGNINGEVKIDKSIPITTEVILFDKIELEKKSPLFILILIGLIIAVVIVYLTTKYDFKFKME